MEIGSIAKKARRELKKIGIDTNTYQVNTAPQHDGSGHIEKDPFDRLHWIITERGHTYQDIIVENEFELLFLVYESITFTFAAVWEAQNRISNQDSRILLFTKHLELLERIDEKYMEKLLPKYQKILVGFEYQKRT